MTETETWTETGNTGTAPGEARETTTADARETRAEGGRVVVVGDALIDEMREPDSLREFPGGAALNVAVGLSVLGVPATLIAMVGDDADGAVLRDFLAAVGDGEHRLVIDPNPRAGMLHDKSLFVRNFERAAARSLLTKVGDEDAELLYGSTLEELRERLVASGTHHVLATAGRAGASIETDDGLLVSEPIAPLPGAVVDTMGGGDATLASSVQSFLTEGVPTDAAGWQHLLASAMRIAAATCRSEGALLRVPPAL